MARALRDDTTPFPLQLEVEFLDRLSEPVRDGKVKSVSSLIRTALENYNLANLVVVRPAQLTISVRLPPTLRRELRHVARVKHTSVGQLVRAAVEAYLPQVEAQAAGQLEMPIAAHPPAAARRKTRRRPRPSPVRKRRSGVKRRGMTRKRAKG
jgi:hypothetical protein